MTPEEHKFIRDLMALIDSQQKLIEKMYGMLERK